MNSLDSFICKAVVAVDAFFCYIPRRLLNQQKRNMDAVMFIVCLILCIIMTPAEGHITEKNLRVDGISNPLLKQAIAAGLDPLMSKKLTVFNKELRKLDNGLHLNHIMVQGAKMAETKEWFHISKECRRRVTQVPLDLIMNKHIYSVHSKKG